MTQRLTQKPPRRLPPDDPLRHRDRQLQALYPELASWQARFVARVWQHYLTLTGKAPTDIRARDETFPAFIVSTLRDTMTEAGTWQ
jgi:hypothetical protein